MDIEESDDPDERNQVILLVRFNAQESLHDRSWKKKPFFGILKRHQNILPLHSCHFPDTKRFVPQAGTNLDSAGINLLF